MKLSHAIAFALLLGPAACRVAPPLPRPNTFPNATTLTKVFGTPIFDNDPVIGAEPMSVWFPEANVPSLAAEPTPAISLSLPSPFAVSSELSLQPDVATDATPGPVPQTLWERCRCRGDKLDYAMRNNKDKAAQRLIPIDSEWDGTLEAELLRWGYRTLRGADDALACDLGDIEHNLNDLGVNARFTHDVEAGPNECFEVQHSGGWNFVDRQTYTVDSRTYRMTDARAVIAVNPVDGMISFLDILSAGEAAKFTWKDLYPPIQELPKLRTISDITWGLWNQMHPNKVDLNKINKFLVHDIMNQETIEVIEEILQRNQLYDHEVPEWPGLGFDITSDDGKALLGSPNGLAAGYFLAQHKTQLGSNKYVNHITIWSDRESTYMLLWVRDAPPPTDGDGQRKIRKRRQRVMTEGGTVVKRSADGKNIIREHVIMAKL